MPGPERSALSRRHIDRPIVHVVFGDQALEDRCHPPLGIQGRSDAENKCRPARLPQRITEAVIKRTGLVNGGPIPADDERVAPARVVSMRHEQTLEPRRRLRAA